MTVRYWAGARRAAGMAEERRRAGTVAELVAQLTAVPGLGALMPSCALLVDGQASSPASALTDDSVIDVLPPFAGG